MEQEFSKGRIAVGIGTGTTIERYIEALYDDIVYVPSSIQTALVLSEKGFVVSNPLAHEALDLYIDGADYFDKNGNVIKGGGGALTTEKLLHSMAKETIIIVQRHKYKERFDGCLVPIEIIPTSIMKFISVLREYRLKYWLRRSTGKVGPLITDLGNCIVDVEYDLDFISECKGICGVVEHGLFMSNGSTMIVEEYRE
ncbi:ribose 5-phosphate isomerase [Encephalitozoon hellem ATCC 50504]|uniref:Ribose-5-phosphate isomerase n=1 Tax=Encephalitozoon hellem TaxID=27973 RepID=A0A9Q9C4M6_ENCHE|nr:ribose 5-phosphate isomerase [Encephalitozoon hellem ATCC 50504]AFM99112.1 ribose 5-phosphate isomerase [Encephalitozoon hellem ATCC 50504]UTX44096.1 ribose 5-phosphate isomerase [Encephalitozoon hellem]|eukprot:XP_003888093.1 ribose 5-phosphate isomerase [Encephalitozoon hellem ATCC 50504]